MGQGAGQIARSGTMVSIRRASALVSCSSCSGVIMDTCSGSDVIKRQESGKILSRARSQASLCDSVPALGLPQPMNGRMLVIVFDWDDTLMCTSELQQNEDLNFMEECALLEEAMLKALGVAIWLGLTVIVTNADRGWVQQTAALFAPAVLPFLDELNVVSAKEAYEEVWPGDPYAWKAQAFQDVVDGAVPEGEAVNLVAVGDSLIEIHAAENVACERLDHSIAKTVKLRDRPTVQDLIGQLEAVSASLPRLAALEDSSSHELMFESAVAEWRLAEISVHCSTDEF